METSENPQRGRRPRRTPEEIAALARTITDDMRHNGAVREGGTVEAYVTCDEMRETYSVTEGDLKRIKLYCHSHSIPLVAKRSAGHYIGEQGEQARDAASRISEGFAKIKSGKQLIEAEQESNVWSKCQQTLKDSLATSRHDLVLDNLPKMLTAMGISVGEAFERLLLEAPKNGDEPA